MHLQGIEDVFAAWRTINTAKPGWGLAWYLAYHIAKRFYASHGIVPHTIFHDGIGYYGIALETVPCPVHKGAVEQLGRITAGGNVENWRTGSPGDHGLELIDRCDEGVAAEELVSLAIRHLDPPVYTLPVPP